ncbi:MAG: hypothetical protein HQ523_02465 [Lentisphaerae bacterium]|nr:hypothetical protein [Lentisphaerota bacterium]
MISQIKKLLRERGPLSLRDLSLHFAMDPDALEPVLKLLVDKQQATVTLVGCSSKGCDGCSCTSLADMMVYKLAA